MSVRAVPLSETLMVWVAIGLMFWASVVTVVVSEPFAFITAICTCTATLFCVTGTTQLRVASTSAFGSTLQVETFEPCVTVTR